MRYINSRFTLLTFTKPHFCYKCKLAKKSTTTNGKKHLNAKEVFLAEFTEATETKQSKANEVYTKAQAVASMPLVCQYISSFELHVFNRLFI